MGLVGKTGCGKSTLINLLLRFYELGEGNGEILLDGKDIRSYELPWLRKQIAVVMQSPLMFSTTVADNIACGMIGATRKEIKRAAKQANAHEFIVKLPAKYDNLVGDKGLVFQITQTEETRKITNNKMPTNKKKLK